MRAGEVTIAILLIMINDLHCNLSDTYDLIRVASASFSTFLNQQLPKEGICSGQILTS
jgi:hypothetical protein